MSYSLPLHSSHPPLSTSSPFLSHSHHLYSVLLHLLSSPPSPRNTILSIRTFRLLFHNSSIDISQLWGLGIRILERWDLEEEGERKKEEWLRICRRGDLLLSGRHKSQDKAVQGREKERKVALFYEHLLSFLPDRTKTAANELDSYLPSTEYHDSPLLYYLAGMIALYEALPTTSSPPLSPTSSPPSSPVQPSKPLPQSTPQNPLIPLLTLSKSQDPHSYEKSLDYFKRAEGLGSSASREWREVMESV